MFVKIPNYYINTNNWTEEKYARSFIILNTKYIVYISLLTIKYGEEKKAYTIEVSTSNGKTFQFSFLNKKTADEYIDLMQKNNMVIEWKREY